MSSPVLAADLGGTNMRAALVDGSGEILERREEPTPPGTDGPAAFVELLRSVLGESGARGAVVGVPGRVHYERGCLEHAPNLPAAWGPALDASVLADRLGIPVEIGNDADLAAVGEARFGAGRGFEDVAFLTISTGVGAGVVLGGRLVRGRRSLAEVGHTVVDRTAAADGRPFTFEDLASGTALGRLAAEAGLDMEGEEVVARVRDGDAEARGVWNALVRSVGIGVANLAHAFAPEVVVVGGGVGLVGDLLLEPVRSALHRYGPKGLREPIEIVPAVLGDDAGLVGAAAWSECAGGSRG